MENKKIQFGNMTVEQIVEVCKDNGVCVRCPLATFCNRYIDLSRFTEINLRFEVDLSESEEIKQAKKTLIECGVMTEDGEIAEAYKDIIVKKEPE